MPAVSLIRKSNGYRNFFTVNEFVYRKCSSLSFSPRPAYFVNSQSSIVFTHPREFMAAAPFLRVVSVGSAVLGNWVPARYKSNASVDFNMDGNFIRFSINGLNGVTGSSSKEKRTIKRVKVAKMAKKAKLNELRFYRLKAKKKMNSPNPEVRIRYKLEKAKRKEAWLIEKLRKFELPAGPVEMHDPEFLTEEEKHYLRRTGEKKKQFVLVGRRGAFGGVILNMHLHWKNHETVRVICRPCRPGEIHEYAHRISQLSKGTVIDIRPNNTIIFFRGKNYAQPKIMSPPDTLTKHKALQRFRYGQSLQHTSLFIEKLERELREHLEHAARSANSEP